MKTRMTRLKRPFATATLLAALAATAGLSIAEPIDDAAKPADQAPAAQRDAAPDRDTNREQAAEQAADQAAEQATQKTTFLGVVVKPVGPSTAERLGLAAGTGLRLMQVAPDSPAEAAGLVAGDVLTHVNDQLLVNPQQLAVLIRSYAAGDTATLRVMRDGEAKTLDATLAQRERPRREQVPAPAQRFDQPRPGIPDDLGQRLIVPDPFGEFDQLNDPFDDRPDGAEPPVALHDLFEQMQQRMNQQRNEMQQMFEQMRQQLRIDRDALGELPRFDARPGVRSSIMINDGEHILQLKTDAGTRHLTVKTIEGEVLYKGELPEDGQVEGLPDDVQQKIDGLLKNKGIELRLNPAPRRQIEDRGPIA